MLGLRGRSAVLVLAIVGLTTSPVAYVLFLFAPYHWIATLLLIPCFAVAMGAVAWFGCQALLIQPIARLTEATRRLHAGDMTALKDMGAVDDEVGELVQSLRVMAGTLEKIKRAHCTLSDSKQMVLRATDELPMLSEMCRIIVKQVGYRVAYITYAAEDVKRTLKPMAQEGFHGGMDALKKAVANVSWAVGTGPVATTIRTGKPYVMQHLITDTAFAPWREDAKRNGVSSGAIFPVNVNGTVIGALAIYAEEADAFEKEELALLQEAVQDLAVGISLIRAREEQNRAKATIEHMAHYDRLTSLPNHALFEERLRRQLVDARSLRQKVAVLIIDLMRLRDINDAFGFKHGDQVLKDVAKRLAGVARSGAMLARMRGDEFAIFARVSNADEAERLAHRALDMLDAPFSIEGVSISVSAVVGIALSPFHGEDGPRLMRHADVAMHEAKKKEKSYAFYTKEQDEDRAQRLAMVSELGKAIAEDQLQLNYQPKINISDGKLCGVEALVRWVHPQRGVLAPDKFIALAEQSGLINALSDWVIGAALRQSAAWRRIGLAVPIAVNLSAHNLRDAGIIQRIENKIAQFGAQPDWLEIEITEGAMMQDPTGALAILARLREMGITLYIDDFGTGYSSLGYLKKLPVNAVKIDKSFVIDMTEEDDSDTIVRTTINLGHALGMKVVAEGVENETAMRRLAELNCDVAQGYHIGKPMPDSQLLSWLDEHRGDDEKRRASR